jgi:choline-sulfatase
MNEFLQRLRGEKRPFFLVQSYRPPHEPYTAPERDMCLYRGKGIFRPGYYASVTALDRCVGDILKTLEQIGARGNTLVIYTSDHGEHFNYRAKNNKTTGHDDSIRIPLIAAWPGRLTPGAIVRGAVGLQDITPTLLDFAGCEMPDYLHGRTLRALMEKPGGRGGECFYVQNTEDFRSFAEWERLMSAGGYRPNSRSHRSPDEEWDRQRALWTPRHKLILSENGNHALFDLERDPEEELDLFGAPKPDFFDQYTHFPDQSETTARLTQMLQQEALRVSDDWGAVLARSVLEKL